MKGIALIKMPWSILDRPSIALSILKPILQYENFPTDIYYLNLRFAKYVNPFFFSQLVTENFYLAEWVFGQCLLENSDKDGSKKSYDDFINFLFSNPLYSHMAIILRKNKAVIRNLIDNIVPQFINECIDNIPWNDYFMVCFSCFMGEQLATLLLSKKIKQINPEMKIVFGGPNVGGTMGEGYLKQFHWVDYVIDGEGEYALPALAKCLSGGIDCSGVPGLVFRENGEVHRHNKLLCQNLLNDLPIPDYTDYFSQLEKNGIDIGVLNPVIPFEGSRGCWWGEKSKCLFCSANNCYIKYRTKAPEKITEEVLYQLNKYPSNFLYSTDDILDSEAFSKLIPLLISQKKDLNIFYEVKSNLTIEQLRLLYKAGIKYVQSGIETFHTELLKLISKGTTAIENISFLKGCNEVGISVFWNLLYRIPGEKRSHYIELMERIPQLSHLECPKGLNRIKMERYGRYYMEPEKFGIRNIEPDKILGYVYNGQNNNLQDIAYTFDFDFNEAEGIVDEYYSKMMRFVVLWQKTYQNRKIYCKYTLKEEFIEICDNRPTNIDDFNTFDQKFVFSGVESHIFIFCLKVRSIEEIFNFITDQGGCDVEMRRLEDILNMFVLKRLMFKEDNKYLSLAVKAN